MISAYDETAIKIHTAPDGIIWYSTGINPPECSGQILDTFLLSPVISRFSTTARVIGIARNAELITSLYFRKAKREILSVCLAGPNICDSMLELDDPALTLMRMRDVYYAASRGGWHVCTDVEFVIYMLLTKKLRAAEINDSSELVFYRNHPLYKVLNFIPGISHSSAINLLTTIIDPRWYVDQRRPDNPTKLNLYLGLTPRVQRRVSDTKNLITRGRDFRCATVLNCWKTQDLAAVDYDLPGNFLWRVYRDAGGGPKGDLRASQAFIHYLRTNWLEIITNRTLAANTFFLQNSFFKSQEERAAFVAAVSS